MLPNAGIVADLPAVGTEKFKRLPLKDQLEIVSLQLFNPDEYSRRVGETRAASPSSGLPDLKLDYPAQPPFSIDDFPVAFLHKYWVGYVCGYKESWYISLPGSRGVTPLDVYGYEVGRLDSLRTFNFSLLALNPAVHTSFRWVLQSYFNNEANEQALLDACKVYTYIVHHNKLPMKRRGFAEVPDVDALYKLAMREYMGMLTFEDLNEYFPMLEPCEELDYLEWNEFAMLSTYRTYRGCDRAFYPVIPASMWTTSRFSIKAWDFVDQLK